MQGGFSLTLLNNIIMETIKDDIILGRCCALCGQYFVERGTVSNAEGSVVIYEHGFPVACNECYEEDCGYQKQSDNVMLLNDIAF